MRTKGKMTAYERKNTRLIALFDELLSRRPDLYEEIPEGVTLVMQVKGDEKFNRWAREIAEKNSPERPKLFVIFSFKATAAKPAAKGGDTISFEEVRSLELRPA